MRTLPKLFLAVCFTVSMFPAAAQITSRATAVVAGETSGSDLSAPEKPMIDKIDPPDWWARFPSPMLLVHGRGLHGAQFTVSGKGVTLVRTQSSVNGHWAFLWLDTKNAPAQKLAIVVRRGSAQASASFPLACRNPTAHGYAGVSPADILYLIMPDRFADGTPDHSGNDRTAARGWHGGDLAGIEQHLDYLSKLGVTTVWTTPVVSNGAMPESYHGYAAVDLYAIDSHLGTLAAYRHLSDALHARGMKLVIDFVPNHVGAAHPWLDDPPASDWFHGTRASHLSVGSDFYQLVDPHAALRDSLHITTGWFTESMPDLNQENPLVEQYLIQNALWWVETAHLDGIRLDTFPYVGRKFWHDFNAALHNEYPHLTTVGEIFHSDPLITSYFAGGATHEGIDTELDTPFDFPVYSTLRGVLIGGKPMTELSNILRQDALYPHPERLVTFIGNHDTTRFLTEAHGSMAKLKLALGLAITLRGTPLIYSGDEIGMTGGDDPDNRRDFPGGFPGDKQNAFVSEERTSAQAEAFAWTSGLLTLRKTHSELRGGIEQNLLATDALFVYARAYDSSGCKPDRSQERILVIVNQAGVAKTAEIASGHTVLAGCTEFQTLVPTPSVAIEISGGGLKITAPAESLTVLSVR